MHDERLPANHFTMSNIEQVAASSASQSRKGRGHLILTVIVESA